MVFSHPLEYFDVAQVFIGFLPVRLVEVTNCEDNVVPARLRKELHTSHIILFHQLAEVLVDDVFLHNELVYCDVGDLQEHRSSHIDAVQSFQVDVKMCGHLSLFLLIFFLSRLLLLTHVANTLSQTFFEFGSLAHFCENFIGKVKLTKSESRETNLNYRSIVEYLIGNMLFDNQLVEQASHQ